MGASDSAAKDQQAGEDEMKTETVVIDQPFFEPQYMNHPWHLSVGQAFDELIVTLHELTEAEEVTESRLYGTLPAIPWQIRHCSEHRSNVELPDGVPTGLNNLFHAIERAMQEAYERGLSDGTDLLRRLASGEITTADISAVRK